MNGRKIDIDGCGPQKLSDHDLLVRTDVQVAQNGKGIEELTEALQRHLDRHWTFAVAAFVAVIASVTAIDIAVAKALGS